MNFNYCIIGAGITGITLAKRLENSIILEKSRGIGGRLAARRLGSHSINHGPESLSFTIDPHAWIKQEASGLHIQKSWEVSKLEVENQMIRVQSTDGQIVECKNLIITSPAPQAKTILERSQIEATFLEPVRYKKVIQLMLLAEKNIDLKDIEDLFTLKRSFNEIMYFEMRDEFLEEFFEKDKEEIKKLCLEKLSQPVLDSHVHKWRYSEVVTAIDPKHQFDLRDKNIYLAGDYFGLDGVESALKSVKNLKL